MSCKPSIDDVQQSAQTVETNYDIHIINRAEELTQRYRKKTNNFYLILL